MSWLRSVIYYVWKYTFVELFFPFNALLKKQGSDDADKPQGLFLKPVSHSNNKYRCESRILDLL